MAEELLDEAGYPRGADGMRLSAIYIHFPRFDVSWPELCRRRTGVRSASK